MQRASFWQWPDGQRGQASWADILRLANYMSPPVHTIDRFSDLEYRCAWGWAIKAQHPALASHIDAQLSSVASTRACQKVCLLARASAAVGWEVALVPLHLWS